MKPTIFTPETAETKTAMFNAKDNKATYRVVRLHASSDDCIIVKTSHYDNLRGFAITLEEI